MQGIFLSCIYIYIYIYIYRHSVDAFTVPRKRITICVIVALVVYVVQPYTNLAVLVVYVVQPYTNLAVLCE